MPANGRSIEFIAWCVLLTAFAGFLAALFGLPWLAVQFVRTATDPQLAMVECKTGWGVQLATDQGPVAVLSDSDGQRPVGEHTIITTLGNAKALVSLFNQSTLHLEPATVLTLERMRKPQFGWNHRPPEIALAVEPARDQDVPAASLSVGTTSATQAFRISTPLGSVDIAPESKVCLNVRTTDVSVATIAGQATVSSRRGSVTLRTDQLTHIAAGGAPDGPFPRQANRVRNPDFRLPPDPEPGNNWSFRIEPFANFPTPTDPATAPDTLGTGWAREDARTVIRFARHNSGGSSADMVYEQVLQNFELDTSGACGTRYLGVTALVRVLSQSLPGGGTRDTEYPVRLKLTLEDKENKQIAWNVGFYAVAPDPAERPSDAQFMTAIGVPVRPGEWTAFDTGNLLDRSSPYSFDNATYTETFTPPLVRLLRLEIIASGHDYESEVDSVGVWVK